MNRRYLLDTEPAQDFLFGVGAFRIGSRGLDEVVQRLGFALQSSE